MSLRKRVYSFINRKGRRNESKGDEEKPLIEDQTKNPIELLNYQDDEGRNLLIKAIDKNNIDKVRQLLEIGFDPESSHNGRRAVSIAYENGNFDIVLTLLENDSKFPHGFNADKISHDGLKAFVAKMREFHARIKSWQELTDEEVETFTNMYPNVRHIYGVDGEGFNCSVVFVSMMMQKLTNVDILKQHRLICTGEEFEILRKSSELKQKLGSGVDGRLHQNEMSLGEVKLAETLCSKSFLGNNLDQPKLLKRYDAAWRMFDELNKIERIKPLLKFLGMASELKIIFDFDRDHCESVELKLPGKFTEHIYLGAEKLLENDGHEKLQIHGKFVTEACRFVMSRMSKNPERERKIKAVVEECKSHKLEDKLISEVLNCKKVKSKEIELVSIVPQHIVLYSHDESKLEKKKLGFPQLYDFYKTELLNHANDGCAKNYTEIDGFLKHLNENTQEPKWKKDWCLIGIACLLLAVACFGVSWYLINSRQDDGIYHGDYGQCGEIKAKILTGQALIKGYDTKDAYPGQWPWLAALFFNGTVVDSKTGKEEIYKSFICGSSLITKFHLLSAAHCFESLNREDYFAVLGQHDLSKHSDAKSEMRDIQSLHVHPDYKRDRKIFKSKADVAVLRMMKSVTFSDLIQPVCFPRLEATVVDRKGVVAGYGMFDIKLHEDTPKYIELRTISAESCIFLSEDHYVNIVSKGSFCAGNSTATPCTGDSGGGFYTNSGDNRKFIVTGVVSQALNAKQCDPNDFVVFVNVLSYHQWIVDQVAICGEGDECVNPCDLNPCEREQKCTVGKKNTHTCL